MDTDTQRILEYLTEVEEAAEDVLTTKQQVNVEASSQSLNLRVTFADTPADFVWGEANLLH